MRYITVNQYVKIQKLNFYEYLNTIEGNPETKRSVLKRYMTRNELESPSLKGKRWDIIKPTKLV